MMPAIATLLLTAACIWLVALLLFFLPAALGPVAWWKLRNLPTRLRGWKAELFTWLGIGCVAELIVTVIRANGTVEHLGVASRRVVTTAGVNALRDAFLNTVELENFNYHAIGTDSTAEATSDTALGAEIETRSTGTQTSAGAGAYRTTASITATGLRAVVEHGVLSASSVGTLLDRSVFSTVNLASGDAIQTQYTLTFTAGG